MQTNRLNRLAANIAFVLIWAAACCRAAQPNLSSDFAQNARPLLAKYCFECHGDGANKGGLTLDNDAIVENRELWFKVLRNVRSNPMPPQQSAAAVGR